MATAEFNPTILFNLLVGSTGSAGKRNPGPILTSLKNDLRKEIEAALPIIYLYDAEVIVESMFTAISPNNTSNNIVLDLSKYISSVESTDSLSSFYSYERNKKKEIVITEQADKDVLSKYTDAYLKAYANKQQFISIVRTAILSSASSNSVKVGEVIGSIAEKQAQLQALLSEVIAIGSPLGPPQVSRFTRLIRAAGRSIRSITSGIRAISDPEQLVEGFNKSSQVLIVAHNFETSKRPNKEITKVISDKLYKEYGIKVRTGTSEFQAGNFAAAGHTGFTYTNDKNNSIYGINTPQLQAASIILAKAGKDAPGLTEKFINNTGHKNWLITVNKQYGEALSSSLSLGLSLVRSQPSSFNSGVLSTQETSLINKEMQIILDASYKDALDSLQKEMSTNSNFHNYVIDVFRMSPTFAENISSALGSILTNTKTSSKVSRKQGYAEKDIVKLPTNILPSIIKASIPKAKQTAKPAPVRTHTGQYFSVTSLQALINSMLPEYMEKNMGKGSSLNVLNYRTGRLAESPKVERMSVSRDGMVTAFYSYMRNPYSTFSTGGVQSRPASRDPKLLIAKSIREIAATKVGNRMRSILV